MIERKDDWDEAFLRYLGGEADGELDRRVRERLFSDESARARFVELACQQQALADALTDAAARSSSSSRMATVRTSPSKRNPGIGWFLAAAAILAAVAGFLVFRPGSDPDIVRKERPRTVPEVRSPERPRPEAVPERPAPAPTPKPKPEPPAPSVPIPEPAKKEPGGASIPSPKPVEKEPETPKPEDPLPAPPAPKPESPTKVVTETVVATVTRVEGEVMLVSGETRAAAAPKQPITTGQGLETVGAASSVEMTYPDGTRVRLEPGTLVKDLADGDKKGKRLFLAKGGLWASVRKQPADQPMTLGTATGEARVLGTTLRLTLDEKGSTRLEVEEGKVRLKRLSDGKAVDVVTGHFAVAAAATTEFKPLPTILSGLAGYWRFEDQAGTTMVDSSGQGNDGALVGKARRVLGKFGQGLELDGATAYVQVPPAAALNPGASTFSLSIWVRNRKQDVWTWNLFFKDDGKLQSYYYFGVGTKPRFEFSTGDAKVTIDGQAGVNDNRWHHLVAVRNGLYSAQLYVDGVLDSSASAAPSQSSTIRTTTPLQIGAGNGSFYAGQIDDARVYSRALTAEEVRQLYSGR